VINQRGLRLVTEDTLRTAHLHQEVRKAQLELLDTSIRALDAVVESLPDAGMSTVFLLDAIELAERVKGSING
jgi:hypothetical protein